MNDKENAKYQGPLPPMILFVMDGEEEINVKSFPQLAEGVVPPSNQSKTIPLNLLVIDGPEEVR